MANIYLIHSSTINNTQLEIIKSRLACNTYMVKSTYSNHYRCDSKIRLKPEELNELRTKINLDINILPENYKPKEIKLVISDMDSTLIAIECVDEIADALNLKKEVSSITESAMRGDIEFEESLKQRVALLKGISMESLHTVYEERLKLNPGADIWLNGLRQKNIKFALVSGGFTYFTKRLTEQYKLDFSKANVLEEQNNKLTGKIKGEIIGAAAKAKYLHELCKKLNITPLQTIAVGDGANDIPMLQVAGLSIAYHAKPTVQNNATAIINLRGLDACLDFLC